MIQINFNELPESIKNARKVEKDELRESGKTNSAFMLHEGDVIEFPAADEIYTIDEPFKVDKREVTCYKFVAVLNGKPKAIPFGVLTKMPFRQIDTWLTAHDVNRELYNASNNLDRLELCAGKKLRVKEMAKGPKAVFDGDGNLKKDAEGNEVTREALFAVFEWA